MAMESGARFPSHTAAIGGLAFELAVEAMMIVTASGQLAAANQAAQELYGFSRDELLSLRWSDLAEGSRPGSQFELPQTTDSPRLHRGSHGRVFPALIEANSLFDEEGRFTGWLATVLDGRDRGIGDPLADDRPKIPARDAFGIDSGGHRAWDQPPDRSLRD
jgi:PAS domain S-box-containing protein